MFESITSFADPLLILPYKAVLAMGGGSLLAFFIGTLVLVLAATVVGELTMAGIYWVNRRHFAELRREMVTNNNLSVRALAMKDKLSYTACNKMANEYFGRNLFSGFTLFASSLWPAFFALAWMSSRFGTLVQPVWGIELRFHIVFICLYVPARILFGLNKKRIWPFNRIKEFMARNEDCGEELLTLSDLMPKNQDKPDTTGKVGDTPA